MPPACMHTHIAHFPTCPLHFHSLHHLHGTGNIIISPLHMPHPPPICSLYHARAPKIFNINVKYLTFEQMLNILVYVLFLIENLMLNNVK